MAFEISQILGRAAVVDVVMAEGTCRVGSRNDHAGRRGGAAVVGVLVEDNRVGAGERIGAGLEMATSSMMMLVVVRRRNWKRKRKGKVLLPSKRSKWTTLLLLTIRSWLILMMIVMMMLIAAVEGSRSANR